MTTNQNTKPVVLLLAHLMIDKIIAFLLLMLEIGKDVEVVFDEERAERAKLSPGFHDIDVVKKYDRDHGLGSATQVICAGFPWLLKVPGVKGLVVMTTKNNGGTERGGGYLKDRMPLSFAALARKINHLADGMDKLDWSLECYEMFGEAVETYLRVAQSRLRCGSAEFEAEFPELFEKLVEAAGGRKIKYHPLTLPGFLKNYWVVAKAQAELLAGKERETALVQARGQVESRGARWLSYFHEANEVLALKARLEFEKAAQEFFSFRTRRDGSERLILVMKTDFDQVGRLVFKKRMVEKDERYGRTDIVVLVASSGHKVILTRGDANLDLAPTYRALDGWEPGRWYHETRLGPEALFNGSACRHEHEPSTMLLSNLLAVIQRQARLHSPRHGRRLLAEPQQQSAP